MSKRRHELMPHPSWHDTRFFRLFDLIELTGKPDYCISYPWSMPFVEMVKQVEHEIVKKGGGAHGGASGVPASLDSIYVWLDVVALNQHTQFNAQADLSLVKSLVKVCFQGIVLVVDSSLIAPSRTWCLFEVWLFVYYEGINKLRVCMPLEIDLDFVAGYEEKVQSLDLTKTESSKPDDKTKILSEIRGSSGVKIMQRSLQEALIVAVRSGLRWGSREGDKIYSLGLFAALLLRCSEYHRLQRLLYSIPDIQDDEAMLKEVEDVFLCYVDGPDDELDESQFCKVLEKSGFEANEVHVIYGEVNSDNGPGVGLDEFKRWWVASKRLEGGRRPPLFLTAESLADNLQRLIATLEREGHNDLVTSIELHMASEDFKRGVRKGHPLPAAELNGDSRAIADQVAWALHNHDYRRAILVLMDVIRWNLDSVDIPPNQLPRPDRDSLSGEAFFLALSLYLEQFALLLKYEQKQSQHSSYFMKFASEMKTPTTLRYLVDSHTDLVQGLSTVKLQFEKFGIVRDMISLKYGPKQPVNHTLIVEAEKSLAMWMAGNRRDAKQSQAMVNNLANDYLSSYNPDKASETSVITMGRGGEVKGLERKKRLSVLLPDGEMPSVLTRLGPEAAAYEAARRAAEATETAEEASGDYHGSGSNVQEDAGRVKKGRERARRSSTTATTSLDSEVALMMQMAGGGSFTGGAFGNIQNRLQRLQPSPSPSPLEQFSAQQSSGGDQESLFAEATGLSSGRSVSALSFSSPSAFNPNSLRSPSFASPPSYLGSSPNRSASALNLAQPKSGKARRASNLVSSLPLEAFEVKSDSEESSSLRSVPGLAASLLASAGFGHDSSTSNSPPASASNKPVNRLMPIERSSRLSQGTSSPLGSPSSPMTSPSPLSKSSTNRRGSIDYLPQLPNPSSLLSSSSLSPVKGSTSNGQGRRESGGAQLPNILARKSII